MSKEEKGRKATVLLKRQKRAEQNLALTSQAAEILQKTVLSTNYLKLLCACIWWCEGNKSLNSVKFTNSDPSLLALFIYLFRSCFKLDEKKFRALLHLHSYHDETKQKEFWSNITNIPLTQFNKSYQKSNTQKRTRMNYPGCITVTYYDAKIAKELAAIYNACSQLPRGVR